MVHALVEILQLDPEEQRSQVAAKLRRPSGDSTRPTRREMELYRCLHPRTSAKTMRCLKTRKAYVDALLRATHSEEGQANIRFWQAIFGWTQDIFFGRRARGCAWGMGTLSCMGAMVGGMTAPGDKRTGYADQTR